MAGTFIFSWDGCKTYLGTPSQLFQNQGNGNNWLEIDLQGTTSNRDGVGARVTVTSGGTNQIREQNTGIHAFAQNAQRLHFGLGGDTNITRLVVDWPSGTRQTFNNVAVNRIIRINETNGIGNVAAANVASAEIEAVSSDNVFALNIQANTINSQEGNDTLTGSAQSDRFVYESIIDGVDTIAQFNPQEDSFVFAASGFGGGLTAQASLNPDAFVLGSAAQDTSDRFVYDDRTGQLFFDPDGSDKLSTIAVLTLSDTPTLSSNNIEIIA